MPPIDLNIDFDYKINSPYEPTKEEDLIIYRNPPTSLDDWTKGNYSNFKSNLKKDHLRKQNDRCAYCRNFVETDGNYEPLEHIVAKSIKPTWMLKVKNLIVTCDPCNNLKNDYQTLTIEHENDIDFPESEDSFIIFNPHHERWSDHFVIEDDIFLVAKENTKGADTIRICKLYRYNIPINNTKLIRMSHIDSYKTFAHKLYSIRDINSEQYIELKEAVDYFELRIDPNTLTSLKVARPIIPPNDQKLLN
jgi:hypothetical protein